jgi:predicted enzyme related to lactoylglutathione lyase
MATQPTTQPSDRKPLPGKFVWFEHVSRDAKRAQAFYGEVLGWKVQQWNETPYEMIKVGDSIDTMVGGYTEPKNEREKAHWISYVSVSDVDATARAAAANGGKVLEAPQDLPGVGRAARIADPQGAELYLFKNKDGDPPDPASATAPPPRRFFWCELHTTDPTGALSFYENVIGYIHQSMDMGDGNQYHTLNIGDVGRAGVTGFLQGAAPHWLPYVAVDDPDATLARAKKQGGKVLMGPDDIPGVGRFGVVEDPTGAVLAVMKAMPPQGKRG